MIFDNSSKNYSDLINYMGNVTFNKFRKTGYYSVAINKDADKDRFKNDYDLQVLTVGEILSNWQGTGMTKLMNGIWYVNTNVLFNVQHEMRHQNYSILEKSFL